MKRTRLTRRCLMSKFGFEGGEGEEKGKVTRFSLSSCLVLGKNLKFSPASGKNFKPTPARLIILEFLSKTLNKRSPKAF